MIARRAITDRECRRYAALPRTSSMGDAAAADPIDDVRGTAAYRLHALAVLARRALSWAWADYQAGDQPDHRIDERGA